MKADATKVAGQGTDAPSVCYGSEWQALALDSLSRLTRQFCEKPDFERLIEVLLMTFCGQFSVGDSFAILKKPSPQPEGHSFFATGHYRDNVLLTSTRLSHEDWAFFAQVDDVIDLDRADDLGEKCEIINLLTQQGVRLVCPLVHDQSVFGIIGLGARLTGRDYSPRDIDLVRTLVKSITPLVASYYLYWQIAHLNAWYLTILDSIGQAVLVFDRHHRLKKINRAAFELLETLGLGEGSIDDLIDHDLTSVFCEKVFGNWADRIRECASKGKQRVSLRILANCKDKQRVLSASITRTPETSPCGHALVVTLEDITNQVADQERLFELTKLAEKGLMAASIAHELNNFIGVILGGTELIEIALCDGNIEAARERIAKLKANMAKLRNFTAGLTDYAKLKGGRQVCDLNRVVTDLISYVAAQEEFRGVEVVTDLAEALPRIPVNADAIAQVLVNLLNNAADAIKQAGREDGKIEVRTQAEDGWLVISVSDNGVGIPPEVRKRLFTQNVTTKEHGHGFGLVTCGKIIADHGGTIEVESEVGKGSTFTIKLPQTPPMAG